MSAFFLPFFRKAKIIPPAVTGATESGADLEDTAESASLQAADDETGIIFRAAFRKDSPRLSAFCYGNKRRINGTNSIFIGKQEISAIGRNRPPLFTLPCYLRDI